MSMGHCYFTAEGRLGNFCYKAAATIAYALKYGLRYTVPTTSRDGFWCPTYMSHLDDPTFDPSLPTITIKEKGWRFQELPYDPAWQDSNILLDGYWQSHRYFDWCREEILELFGFPWTLRQGFCGVHLRRGDYLVHRNKHPAVPDSWYLDQMTKFPGYKFNFFSDDMDYVLKTFGGIAEPVPMEDLPDNRHEVRDLVALSQCEHVIGSASTFAVMAGILNRNPNKKIIIPKQWLVEGWQSTTAKDWLDVCPTSEGWERA